MHKTLLIALAGTAVAVAAIPAVSMAATAEVSKPSTLKWAPCPADVDTPVTLLASMERALRLRFNRLLDGATG